MVCLVKIDEPPNRRSASIGVDVEDSNVSVVPEPLVSVLLPTHNRPVWLAEAIQSVLAGDFIDFEVVVSNNDRPERTRELAKVVRDDRIRWFEQDRDTGIPRRMLEDQRMRAHAGVLQERLARDHLTAGAALLRRGARQRAREHLVNSTRMQPSWKATAGLAASWLAPAAVLTRI